MPEVFLYTGDEIDYEPGIVGMTAQCPCFPGHEIFLSVQASPPPYHHDGALTSEQVANVYERIKEHIAVPPEDHFAVLHSVTVTLYRRMPDAGELFE